VSDSRSDLFIKLPTTVVEPLCRAKDFSALKVAFALAICAGRFRSSRRRHDTFPASLADLSATGHLSRNDAVAGLDLLLQRQIIERVSNVRRPKGVPNRTPLYRFVGDGRFLKFPYQHVQNAGVLKSFRRSDPVARLAMSIYLLLGEARSYQSGEVWLSYDTITARLDESRLSVNAAMYRLRQLSLIEVHQPGARVAPRSEERHQRFHYKIRGVFVDPRSLEYQRVPVRTTDFKIG
jgi:hypothetical protein